MIRRLSAALGLAAFAPTLWAADALTGAVQKQPLNVAAIVMFVVFVAFTLYITYWASKRTRLRRTIIRQVARSPASRTVWRLPVTTCRQRPFWGFPHWSTPPATMA